jgi:hypothetical protein
MKRSFSLALTCATLFLVSGCKSETTYDLKCETAIAAIILIVGLFVILSIYTNLLRDEVSNIAEFNQNAQLQQQKLKWKQVNKAAPFSLTKVQFGLWTVIISSFYIYLTLCKVFCAAAQINQTALALMGIFAGTAVASSFMDKNEMNDNRPRHQNSPSQGFFIDILSDDNGISLHRFQNLAWTIIAIIVYLYKTSVITAGCELPELSNTLLALTGLSSATYLALKVKENDPPAVQPALQNGDAANISAATPVDPPPAQSQSGN